MASGSGAKRRVQKCIEINLARRGVASSSLGTAACAKLESRRVIRVAGGDSLKFLQGLVTNDVNTLSPQQPLLYTHLLNHKGRSLFDMFVYLDHRSATGEEEEGNIYLLDCREDVADTLLRLLQMYKLRSNTNIADVSGQCEVWGLFPKEVSEGYPTDEFIENASKLDFLPDPRSTFLGFRRIFPGSSTFNVDEDEFQKVDESYLDINRRYLGVLEGLELSNQIPLECNLDLLNGVSYTKGCYVGQELTARTHFQGLVRKRNVPVFLKVMDGDDDVEPTAVETTETVYRNGGEKLADTLRSVVDSQNPAFASSEAEDSKTTIPVFRSDKKGRKAGKLIVSSLLTSEGAGGESPSTIGLAMALLKTDTLGGQDGGATAQLFSTDSAGRRVQIVPFIPPWFRP